MIEIFYIIVRKSAYESLPENMDNLLTAKQYTSDLPAIKISFKNVDQFLRYGLPNFEQFRRTILLNCSKLCHVFRFFALNRPQETFSSHC